MITKLTIFSITVLLVLMTPYTATPATEWHGSLSDGRTISQEDLAAILKAHAEWVVSEGERGTRADLSGAMLVKATFTGVDLSEADLSNANLRGADLRNASLIGARLIGAELNEADLTDASLYQAIVSGARLQEARLTKAFLVETKLDAATLWSADLRGADLRDTDLSGAELNRARLNHALFEPKPGSITKPVYIGTAQGLWSLWFRDSPHGLVELRDGFRKAGLRRPEREVTFAIERTWRRKMWKEQGFVGKLKSGAKYLLFELTCDYGMSPGRPLSILALLVFIFVLPYALSLTSGGREGIWRVWSPDRVRQDLGGTEPESIRAGPFRAVAISLYFSVLSAFRMGWRDINVGNWIARIQPREYTLRATGWVRVVSGVQSLISVYLLALWAITAFGRPFQ